MAPNYINTSILFLLSSNLSISRSINICKSIPHPINSSVIDKYATCKLEYLNPKDFRIVGPVPYLTYLSNLFKCRESEDPDVKNETKVTIGEYIKDLCPSDRYKFHRQDFCQIAEESYQSQYKNKSYHIYHEESLPFCGITLIPIYKRIWEPPYGLHVFSLTNSNCRVSTMILYVILFILSFLVIMLNFWAILILSLQYKLQNRTPQQFYKISLAVSDLIIGAFSITSSIRRMSILIFKTLAILPGLLHGNETQEEFDNYCRTSNRDLILNDFLFGPMTIIGFTSSYYTLAFSSMDRYHAIKNPLQYLGAKGVGRINVVLRNIIIIWSISIVVGFVPDFIGVDFNYISLILLPLA